MVSSASNYRAFPLISTHRSCPGGWRKAGLRLIARRIRKILECLLDAIAGAENRAEVVTVGLMARRRYFVKQGNLLSLLPRFAEKDAQLQGRFSNRTTTIILSIYRIIYCFYYSRIFKKYSNL